MSEAPMPGEFCDRHFSWLCQAGQGLCDSAKDRPVVVNMSTSLWLEQLAHAWDLGHLGLCRRHGVAPFEVCRNPYRITSPAATEGDDR